MWLRVGCPTDSATTAIGSRESAGEADFAESSALTLLERCLELLAKEIDVEIIIQGADLQAEGITRNQSFGLDERQAAGRRDPRSWVLQLANASRQAGFTSFKPHSRCRQEAIFYIYNPQCCHQA